MTSPNSDTMPTARELLEQADALMRRNRGSGGGDTGIPLLTDSVAESGIEPTRRGPSTRERSGATLRVPDARSARGDKGRDDRASVGPPPDVHPEPSRWSADVPVPSEPSSEPAAAAGEVEPPVLTDVVEEVAIDLPSLPAEKAEDDAFLWLGPDTIDPALHSITGPAPDTVGVVPPVTTRSPGLSAEPSDGSAETELPDPTATRTFRAAGSATMPPPAGSTPAETAAAELGVDDERWRALAEQISMQVLQRLDLFTDTGLKAQLAAHLQPIVARAGVELVEAINHHVGQLVRSYVAEAIEREIAQWRQQQQR
jgi:hypothetical protein